VPPNPARNDSIATAVDSTGEAPKFGDYVYVEELPEAIMRVPPKYPEAARAARAHGTVMVQALVRKDGSVGDVRVAKSIAGLDEAAMECVRQWKFKPALGGIQGTVLVMAEIMPDGSVGGTKVVESIPARR